MSTTPGTLTSSAPEKNLKRLHAIEKMLSAPPALSPRPTTYADSVRLATSLDTQEKPVPSRAIKKVLIKVIGERNHTQTIGRPVKSINAARSRAGKVLAAGMLESGDVFITPDSHKTKNFVEQEEK